MPSATVRRASSEPPHTHSHATTAEMLLAGVTHGHGGLMAAPVFLLYASATTLRPAWKQHCSVVSWSSTLLPDNQFGDRSVQNGSIRKGRQKAAAQRGGPLVPLKCPRRQVEDAGGGACLA